MKKYLIITATLCFGMVFSQKQVQRATVAFMNVENLWDTVSSFDYIDGTKDVNNPAFHRSVPLDSIDLMDTTEDYRGPWSNELVKDKKVIRRQILADDFTANSAKNWDTQKYNDKMGKLAKVISELGRTYTNDNPAIMGLLEIENRQVVQDLISQPLLDRKSTRLNSSHVKISYAVFCLK